MIIRDSFDKFLTNENVDINKEVFCNFYKAKFCYFCSLLSFAKLLIFLTLF